VGDKGVPLPCAAAIGAAPVPDCVGPVRTTIDGRHFGDGTGVLPYLDALPAAVSRSRARIDEPRGRGAATAG